MAQQLSGQMDIVLGGKMGGCIALMARHLRMQLGVVNGFKMGYATDWKVQQLNILMAPKNGGSMVRNILKPLGVLQRSQQSR